MSDNEFLDLVDATLLQIENAVEARATAVEASRAGNVLTLEFEDATKIIINSQVAMHELWVAARSGGFHFRRVGSEWRDTREGSELFAALSVLISEAAGTAISLAA